MTNLLNLILFLNNYPTFVAAATAFLVYPIFIFIEDGLNFSNNKKIKLWQNFSFLSLIFFFIFILIYVNTDIVSCSDGLEQNIEKVRKFKNDHDPLIKNLGYLGNALGDGLVFAGGAKALSASLAKSSLPLGFKALAVVMTGGGAILTKRGAQNLAEALFPSNTGGSQGSGSSGTNPSSNNVGTSMDTNSNNINNFSIEDNLDMLNTNFNGNLLFSTNDYSFFNKLMLINSDNSVEVVLGCIFVLKIISLIMFMLLLLTLIFSSYFNSINTNDLKINQFLKSLIKFINKYFLKSLKLNIILISISILISDIGSLFLLNLYISNLEDLSRVFLNLIK